MTEETSLSINLLSFGHAFGVPKRNDKVFDLRQFRAPPRELCRTMDGTSKRLQSEILNLEEYRDCMDSVATTVDESLRSGKILLVLAIGCEEGRHRSVALVEFLKDDLPSKFPGAKVEVEHRDLGRRRKQMKAEKDIRTKRQHKYQMYETAE